MKCEICQQAEADSVVRIQIGGQQRELHLCRECLGRRSAAEAAVMPYADIMVELLFHTLSHEKNDRSAASAACPSCAMTYEEFRSRSRLGCQDCYHSFSNGLEPILRNMHRGKEHFGKVPVKARETALLARLEKDLEKAVLEQRFEDAARIRDAIKGLAPPKVADTEKAKEDGYAF